MNNFFCKIGETLSNKIPHSSNPLLDNDYEVNPKSEQFHFEIINVPQIERVLGKFDTSKGSGPDGMRHFQPLSCYWCFPDSWKIALRITLDDRKSILGKCDTANLAAV